MVRNNEYVQHGPYLPPEDYEPVNSYQDDLHDDLNTYDPAMDEMTEDPAEELGIPPAVFAEELDEPEMFDNPDDAREYTEDLDEDFEDETKAA